MGKGITLAFKKALPDVFRAYKDACEAGQVVPGRVQVVEPTSRRPKYVINFPTKKHWRDKSTIEDIEVGLSKRSLRKSARDESNPSPYRLSGVGLAGSNGRSSVRSS